MKLQILSTTALLGALVAGPACAGTGETGPAARKTVAVNPAYFIKESLLEDIVQEERELSDGTKALCYVIKTKSMPHEHEAGPWSPKTISDGKDKGGIWFAKGEIHQVDGPFVKHIGEFYDDPAWMLYREDGTVKITETKEAFLAAARPDVDAAYHNHVVEGKAEWFDEMVTTYVIPVTPIYSETPNRFAHGAIGLAFNGVHYDPPAPTDAILRAHTLAPLDPSGGHLNPYEGYHYHAVMGNTKEIAQADGHAPQIGYALDGFAIFAHLDEEGKPAVGLDECGGHADDVRGYHYHAGAAADNQILKAYRGVPGTYSATPLAWAKPAEGNGQRPGGRPPGGPGGPPPQGGPPQGGPLHEHSTDASQAGHSHSHDGEAAHPHDGEDPAQ